MNRDQEDNLSLDVRHTHFEFKNLKLVTIMTSSLRYYWKDGCPYLEKCT